MLGPIEYLQKCLWSREKCHYL